MGKKNKRVRPDDPVKCIAHSSRTGNPCQRPPMRGQNVCYHHGGAASAARRRAAERIALASDKAAAQLFAFMNDESVPHNVRLAAAKDLLDRANVSGKQVIELEVKPWEEILSGIVADIPEGETAMRPFVEAQPKPDPLVIEAHRADEDYAPDDKDYSDPWAYGHDLPSGLPVPSRASNTPAREPSPAPTVRDGSDRPPPQRPTPGPRRIEPEDRPHPRRRVAGRR